MLNHSNTLTQTNLVVSYREPFLPFQYSTLSTLTREYHTSVCHFCCFMLTQCCFSRLTLHSVSRLLRFPWFLDSLWGMLAAGALRKGISDIIPEYIHSSKVTQQEESSVRYTLCQRSPPGQHFMAKVWLHASRRLLRTKNIINKCFVLFQPINEQCCGWTKPYGSYYDGKTPFRLTIRKLWKI